MSQSEGFGTMEPLGGGKGDDLGDLKVKRGGGAVIAVLFVLGLLGAAAAGVWYFGMREDPAVAHETFRREVLGPAYTQYYEEFWACALNEPLANFKNNSDLQAKIRANGSGADTKRYGQHLLESEKCLPLLTKAMPEYQALKTNPATPADYHELLGRLATDLEGVQRAWTAHAEHLAKSDQRRDLRERIKSRGEHWVGYQSSINHKVPEKVAHYTPNAVSYTQFVQCVLGDRDFASFAGAEGQSAQDEAIAYLDQQCAQNRAVFLSRVDGDCRSKLFPVEVPQADDAFAGLVKHWTKVENDFGTALPFVECLEEAEEDQTKTLVEGIAKAWYGFSRTYREIVDLSKTKSSAAGQ
jgi:hypothetical protein